MAFGSPVAWEVRTTGADTNGGGFDSVSGTPGTDYSRQTSPQVVYTDLVIGATTTQCTSVGNPFTSVHVGNIINITSGTNFTVQRVQVMSVAAGIATCDKSLGTAAATGGHGNLGGCFASLGAGTAVALAVAGNTIWAENTATYTIGSAISPANNGSSGLPICLIGYGTTRGDNVQITVQLTGGSYGFITGAQYWRLVNIVVDCNSRATSTGFYVNNNYTVLSNCVAKNFTTAGFAIIDQFDILSNCLATAGSSLATAGFVDTQGLNSYDSCEAIGNVCPGFIYNVSGTNSYYLNCISANNTGASSDGFRVTQVSAPKFRNCIGYGNGRDGLRFVAAGGADAASWKNCIFYGNAGVQVNSVVTNYAVGPSASLPYLAFSSDHNAYVSGGYTNLPAGPNDVTLTNDPFVAGASNNFALNLTAGAGAACRAAGFPGALQSGGTGYLDIGALQHQDSPAVIAPVYNMVETRYQ